MLSFSYLLLKTCISHPNFAHIISFAMHNLFCINLLYYKGLLAISNNILDLSALVY